MKHQFLIGDLAQRARVATSLVRYYEEIGLLPPATRGASGYRVYHQSDVERLLFIRQAKALDFSLEEIKEIMGLREQGEAPCAYVVNQISAKINQIERKIPELNRLKVELEQLKRRATQLPPADIEAKSCVCHLIENQHNPKSA